MLRKSNHPSSRYSSFKLALHCTKHSRHIFPKITLRCHFPNIYIHVSVSDLYIPWKTYTWNISIAHRYMNVEIGR
jgi:hypothetical protein